ncbi:uncharacterized protein [Dermacentor albipictus]|uniref:uncharacterized protein n=1 Tax=Dermacentor albipictus TaxID=60249 RepID=UPI0031FDCF6F
MLRLAIYSYASIAAAFPEERSRWLNVFKTKIAVLLDLNEDHRLALEAKTVGSPGSQAKQQAWDSIASTLCTVAGVRQTTAEKKKWGDLKSPAKARVIDDTKISKVVDCVKENASEEIAKKIDAARVGLQCPDIPCALRKLCNKHHGRIPAHSTKAFYSNEDKAIIRGLFDTCREQS